MSMGGNPDWILAGTKVEAEHIDTHRLIERYVAKHGRMMPADMMYALIAMDHLQEHEDYYDRLQKAGL